MRNFGATTLMDKKLKRIILARDYGFCMGVKRAIKIAEETGSAQNGPVNVIHEIVHNDSVVRRLAREGIGHVSNVADAPGGTIIVSAHGAPPALFEEARSRGLRIIDATCPLVVRIHKTIHRLIEQGYQIIHFGDQCHDETIGVLGQAPAGQILVVQTVEELSQIPNRSRRSALTAQTTASIDDFKALCREARRLFPHLRVFNTICNATSRRQAAVLEIAPQVDVMLIVGSNSSANSIRLRHTSEAACGRAYLIDSADSLKDEWLDGIETIGLTAGASTPDFLVEEVIDYLVGFSGGKAELVRWHDVGVDRKGIDRRSGEASAS